MSDDQTTPPDGSEENADQESADETAEPVDLTKDDDASPAPAPAPAAPANPTPAPKSNKTVLMVVAAVVVLALVGVGAFFLLRKGNGPEAVAQRYFDRAKSKDCTFIEDFSNKVVGATSDKQRKSKIATFEKSCKKSPDTMFSSKGPLKDCKLTTSDLKTKNDTASLKYKITGCKSKDDNDTGSLKFVKEDGVWRING